MFDAGAAVGRLRLDTSGWTKNVTTAQVQAKTMKARLGELGQSARAMAIPFAVAGAAIALSMRKIREEAMHVEEAENLFVVSMGNMAEATREWSEELAQAIGMNANSIREQVATFNVMLGSMGLTEIGAATLSKEMTKLAYDMASFYNIDVQSAFDKIRGGITGEAEGLKRLGIVLLESTVQTYAWTHGIAASGQALTEQQKILARVGSLLDQTGKAQGDLARTADSATNQQRRLQESFLALRQELGKASAEASGPWYGAASRAMQAATAWAKENEQLAGTLTKVAAGTGYAMIGFAAITFAGPGLITVFHGIAVAAGVAWAAILGPTAAVVAALAAIGASAYVLRAEFKQHLYGMQADFQWLVNAIGKGLELLGVNFRECFGSIAKIARTTFNQILGGWMGVNETINSLLRHPTDLNAALDAGVAAAQKDYFGKITGYIKEDFKATWLDLKAIGAATAEQMRADMAGIFGKFPGAPKQTFGEQVGSWFGDAVTEYKLPSAEELNAFIAAGAGGVDKAGAAAAKSAETAAKQLVNTGKAAYLALVPVAGAVADITDRLTSLKAAGLVTDQTRSLLGADLWKQIEDLAPAAIRAIIDQVAALDPAIAKATESARKMAASVKADEILTAAQPHLVAFEQIRTDLEALKEAGRLTGETENIMFMEYWRQFGNMAPGEIQKLIDMLVEVGTIGAEAANQINMLLSMKTMGGGDDDKDSKNPLDAMLESTRKIGFELNQIAKTTGATVVSKIGQATNSISGFAQGIGSAVTAFKALKSDGEKSTTSTISGIASLTSGVMGAIGAVLSLGEAFGLFGKKGKEEITAVDKLMKGLEEVMNNMIDSFADAWVDFLETGKFEFKEFIDSILKDFARMTSRLAMQEIVGSLTGMSFSAKGNVFKAGNIVPFRAGGVVSQPTIFPMPKGRLGMMAEDSEEGIFPLRRNRSGELGVIGQAGGMVVNIFDERRSGERIKVEESRGRDGTRQLQITVRDTLESLAAEGGLTRTLRLAGIGAR